MAAAATTTGQELEQQLLQAIHAVEQAPLPGARDLPVLSGIDLGSTFNIPQENVLVCLRQILAESNRVFTFGNSVVMQVGRPGADYPSLVTLSTDSTVEKCAPAFLANLLVCAFKDKEFPPPVWFVNVALRAESLLPGLPRINHYAPRPVFDDTFTIRGPGWHPGVGYLVLGPDIDPILPTPPQAGLSALERLPVHLQTLLSGFCFREPADLVNTIAVMLTGLLSNHFVQSSKALVLVDGNQPGLGKTLLIRVIGIVLDGIDPRLIRYTPDDEELQKSICATLRGSSQSIVLVDNAKTQNGSVIDSRTIEANSMAPEVSLRILGQSSNYTRPNDLLWAITMNDTRISSDGVSRGLPIRMAYDGDPKNRQFTGPDPIEYARNYRLEILGELAGMVVAWNQAGRPPGSQSHRCHYWASVIGGILQVAGFPEFLDNAGEASAAFNSAFDDLAALAEAAAAAQGAYAVFLDPNPPSEN